MNNPTALRIPRRRLLLTVVPSLLAVIAGTVYFVAATKRTEPPFKEATLLELQYETQKDPHNPRIFSSLGDRAQQLGQKHLALDSYEQAATMSPHDANAWLTWARAAAALQGSRAAIDVLNTFLQVHPQNAEAHLMLARIFGELEDHPRSFAEAKIAAQYDPKSDSAWRLAGKEALKNHDYYTAEEAFRHAVALAPKDWETQQGLGDALFASTRYSEAVTFYREAARLNPAAGVAHLTLGETLLHLATTTAEIDAARVNLQQALTRQDSLTPDGLFLTYLAMGQSYVTQKRWKEALLWLQKAVPYEPVNANVAGEVHFVLAQAYRGVNDLPAASREMNLHAQRMLYNMLIRKFGSRILAHPDDPQGYLNLARLYAAHRDDKVAADLYRQALGIAPDMKAAQQELTELLRRHPH